MGNNILKLVKKEIQLEWRQKTALGTIFIYVLGTAFLIYLVFITKLLNLYRIKPF